MKKLIDTSADPSSEESENLSQAEMAALRLKLKEDVQIFHEARNGWKAAPVALTRIRDQRLYRAEGFSDFGRFCKEELKIGKSTVNRHIAIGEVYNFLASTGAKVLPSSERQMRPLLALRKVDESPTVWQPKVVQVWEKAVNDAEVMKKHLTEKSVILAMNELGLKPTSVDVPSAFDDKLAWIKIENLLWHEREFWPTEQRKILEDRLADLLCLWRSRGSSGDDPDHVKSMNGKADLEPANVESTRETQPEERGVATDAAQTTRQSVWSLVNWNLSNSDLAKIWTLEPKTVRQTRYRKKAGPASVCDQAEYEKLLEAEKVIAKKSRQAS